MSLETDLQSVIASANALNTTVQGKIDNINNALDDKVADVTATMNSTVTSIKNQANSALGTIGNKATLLANTAEAASNYIYQPHIQNSLNYMADHDDVRLFINGFENSVPRNLFGTDGNVSVGISINERDENNQDILDDNGSVVRKNSTTGETVIELDRYNPETGYWAPFGGNYSVRGGLVFGNSSFSPKTVKCEVWYGDQDPNVDPPAVVNTDNNTTKPWFVSRWGSPWNHRGVIKVRWTGYGHRNNHLRLIHIFMVHHSSLARNFLGSHYALLRGRMDIQRNGNLVGSIVPSATGTAFNTTSDYRVKENVIPMTDGLEKVKGLRPTYFNFVQDPSRTVGGFLAHEAQEVVPESVTGVKDGIKEVEEEVVVGEDADGNPITEIQTKTEPDLQSIDQAKLVPVLAAAIQELAAKVEALENA
jgi:hypothetical protein